MANNVTDMFSIDNKSLLETLQKLPLNIQKNIMVGATRAGANIVRDEARRLVPVRTRALLRSISTVRRKDKGNVITFSVTPKKGKKFAGWRAHFIEFGTVHMRPQPFLRPAIETTKDEVLQEVKRYVADRLPMEIIKSGGGNVRK